MRFRGFLFPEFNKIGDLRIQKEVSRGRRKCRCKTDCSEIISIDEICISISYPVENKFAPRRISSIRKSFKIEHSERCLLDYLKEYFPGKKKYVEMIVKQIIRQKEEDDESYP